MDSVARFRLGMRAWNDQDWQRLGAFYASDAVLRHPEGWPEPGPTVGREAIVGQWQSTWQAFGGAKLRVLTVSSADEWVVGHLSFEFVGGASGLDVTTDFTAVCRFRDGECVEHRVLWGHLAPADAVAAQVS